MTVPRWKKVLADLWGNKARTLLVALSILAGVFSIGFVANAYIILQADIPADYLSANPRSARIYTDPFDGELLAALQKTPGLASVEGRSSVSVKLNAPGGKTYPMEITRTPAIGQIQIDQLRLEQGTPGLRGHEIYLERQVASGLGYRVGDTLQVALEDGRTRDLRIAGIVHDVTGNPFDWSKEASAFTNADTLTWLGGPAQYTLLLLRVSEKGTDEDHVRQVASAVADRVIKSGRRVYTTLVIQPGQHSAQKTVNTLLALCGGLGIFALFLSGFLVINTISSLMSQQVRQIGVMKAVGATLGQVTGLYLALVSAYGLVALLLAIPAAAISAYAMAAWFCSMMNVNMGPFRIPAASILLQVAIGLIVPVTGALAPVIGGARLTVREAISNYGLGAAGNRRTWFDSLMGKMRGLPRPLTISIRNTFRRKGRLALTLSTLVLGGAIFISVFSIRDAIYNSLEKTFGYTLADVNVSFSRLYRLERLQEAVKSVPGVVSAEGWGIMNALVMKADEKTGDDVQIMAPPAGSQLIEPVITSGRWLLPEDQNAVIVGNHLIKLRPDIKVGDLIQVRIGEEDHPFQIVGVFEMAGTPAAPIIFTNYEYLAQVSQQTGQAANLRIVTDLPTPARQQEVLQALEVRFKELQMPANLQTGNDTITQQSKGVDILVIFLLVMAVLISMVGGLGLMGTMSMNVMERTREIGVMRSIGAVNEAIFKLVVSEGMLIGLLSWAMGALVSIPISQLMDQVVGVSLLNVPLRFVFSPQGLWIWWIVVLVLSGLASLLPARNAVRLTVRDVLAYE